MELFNKISRIIEHLLKAIIILAYLFSFFLSAYIDRSISSTVFLLISLILYIILIKDKSESILNNQNGLVKGICTACKKIKGIKTKHCYICNKCYYKKDHHCMLIGKCISDSNMKTLYFWSIFSFISCFFLIFNREIKTILVMILLTLALNILWLSTCILYGKSTSEMLEDRIRIPGMKDIKLFLSYINPLKNFRTKEINESSEQVIV